MLKITSRTVLKLSSITAVKMESTNVFFIDNIWESITNLQLLIYVGVVSQSIISPEYG